MDKVDIESRSALRAIIHRYQFAFFVLVVFLAGLALIVGVEFFKWPSPLSDLGVAFLAAGAVGLGLEYYTRSQFNKLVKDSVVEAVNATDLERRITELAGDASLGEHFRASGLRRLHATRRTVPFREHLEATPPGAEIAFLGICLRGFLNEESQTILIQKAEDGCKIRMLVIDPDSNYVSQRAGFESREMGDIKADIEAACRLHLNLMKNKMPPDCFDRFSIRYYDAPVNLFLFRADDKGVVGFYLDGNRGEFFPQIEFSFKDGELATALSQHYESLWSSAREVYNSE